MDLNFLYPYFLGPHAENQGAFEDFLLEFLRDHAYYRRNFHPEDGNTIPTQASFQHGFLKAHATMRQVLRELSSELKKANPFYSPRYIGHMNSDLLIPGLIAQMMTMLYNPNNVAFEAGPATVNRELEVGLQLAKMFGFNVDPSHGPCAWGHLTSGGTVANYQALWQFREVKYYPIALREACLSMGLDFEAVGPQQKKLSLYSKWELLNFSIGETIELLKKSVRQWMHLDSDPLHRREFLTRIESETLSGMGGGSFFRKHAELGVPVVLVPYTAHYSWEKAMKILGLGTEQLVRLDMDDHMRLDPESLRRALELQRERESPVLAIVGVLGSTEFSNVDPIHRIVDIRQSFYERGLYSGIHVDAAWGGYLASMFRRENGEMCAREEVAEELSDFPSENTYQAFKALRDVDSITVDPHKLGYLPYPCGAFVVKDMGVIDFVAQKASYLYDVKDEHFSKSREEKLRNLGQFVMEGSKPGSVAAAAYVTHKVLPLHKHGFGYLVKFTVKACEYFQERLGKLGTKLMGKVIICQPFQADTNIVCFTLNPRGNRSLALMNHFARKIFEHLKVNPDKPLQTKMFIGSYTSISKDMIGAEKAKDLLTHLGVNPDNFCENVLEPNDQSNHIFLFRHSLMSPWLLQEQAGQNFIDRYCDYLEGLIWDTLNKE